MTVLSSGGRVVLPGDETTHQGAVIEAAFKQLLVRLRPERRPIIAVGNFDGVHLGHQAILSRVRRRADALDTVARVLTFEPHPVTIFGKRSTPDFRLTDPSHKAELLRQIGGTKPIVLPFAPALYELSPAEFAQYVLHEGLGAREVWVGYDFNFGKGRVGGGDDLRRFGAALGFSVEVHDAVHHGGSVVSSTRIRKALSAGRLEEAQSCLGRRHALRGRVVPGAARGRTMGFPTLNVRPEAGMMVPHGAYATRVRSLTGLPINSTAVTNIGVRPTVDPDGLPNVESFLLTPPEHTDLGGAILEIELLSYLRPEQKFPSVEALKAQIGLDVERARALHGA